MLKMLLYLAIAGILLFILTKCHILEGFSPQPPSPRPYSQSLSSPKPYSDTGRSVPTPTQQSRITCPAGVSNLTQLLYHIKQITIDSGIGTDVVMTGAGDKFYYTPNDGQCPCSAFGEGDTSDFIYMKNNCLTSPGPLRL